MLQGTFCPADIQYKTNQVLARSESGPRVYCMLVRSFAAAGRDLGPGRGRLYAAAWGVVVAGRPVQVGTAWQDTFWLWRWSLSLQPPPLLLFPSRPSRTCVRFGQPATGSGPTRPVGHAVADSGTAGGHMIRVASEWRERSTVVRTLPRRNLPLRSGFKFAIASLSSS